jgi:hypothetical protein
MNRLSRTFCVLVLLGLSAFHGAWAQQRLQPVDEAATRPDFFSFRAQLLADVARRDVKALLAVVHKDVKNSFGGIDGIDEFKTMWDVDSADSKVWETLATVLGLGGSFTADHQFTAPYVFSRWPRGVPAYDFVAITGNGVRARVAPEPSSEVLASLSYDIVEPVDSTLAGDDWAAIRLPGGKLGFVAKRYVRSPIDYRAIFEKLDGRWQMSIFIAGD